MKIIEIIKPDDWHVHFRDGKILKAVVPETSRNFKRALVMPNLIPPVITEEDAVSYKRRIQNAAPNNDKFLPLMTAYLTEMTDKEDLKRGFINNNIFALKLYPSGATTNSDLGVKNISKIMPILEMMSTIGMPLLIHGEVTDSEIDIFDREKIFIDTVLDMICKSLPELKVTLEHITTNNAVDYIKSANHNLVASITPHHLALNRNALFSGGINPHLYCLPILKRDIHRKSLVQAATSGNKKFFLGTDTAPHALKYKENSCGCAGIFKATDALNIVTQIFDENQALENLEAFTSINGANHYKLKINSEKIKIVKKADQINFIKYLKIAKNDIVIFKPEFPVYWEVLE